MTPKRAVLIDFDGTASRTDVGGRLLEHFAEDASWHVIDNDYLTSRIGSRTAYRLAEGLLHHDAEAWLAFALDLAELDPGLGELVALCQERQWLVEILSDGLEFYIDALLARADLVLPVRANRVGPNGRHPRIFTPYLNPRCGRCGTCKSDRVLELQQRGWEVVFVGDGYSDFCAAPKADRLFAKSHLAEHCDERQVPYQPYDTLDQVARALAG